jgi:hypothetical protein
LNASLPRHSKSPWKNNEGSIETESGRVVCYVTPADDACLNADEYERDLAECAANAALITAAPGLFVNLRYAVWCLENLGIPPTPDALANMRTALAAAEPAEGGVS